MSKAVPLLAMQALRGKGFPLALDGVSGQHHSPATFYPWEMTPSAHWIGGSELVWTQKLEENHLPLPGIEP
jgi:hypothetical protein